MTRSLREAFDAADDDGRVETLECGGVSYRRVVDDVPGAPRGVVCLEGRHVPAFPSIGRIFALEAGVRHNMPERFSVEEKIDGYNVRIVRAGGQIVAFTRGGWACPFTIDRLPDLVDLHPLFDEVPDAVVCAEIAGPGNPYLQVGTPHVDHDVGLFAFDLMRLDRRETGDLDLRDQIFERHRLPRAPVFGRLSRDHIERLRAIVLDLDAQGSEGVVLKPLGSGLRVKYVTPATNLSDIVGDTDRLAELPGEFFTGRIVRLVLAVEELGLTDRLPDMERQLGRTLLEGFEQALADLRDTGVVAHYYTVRVNDEATIDHLLSGLNHASRIVQVREIDRHHDGTHHVVRFRKTLQRSTAYLKTILAGQPVID